MEREHVIRKLLLALLLLCGVAHADAFRVGSGIKLICQTSAPAPINTARVWIRCSDGHVISTSTANADVDMNAGGGGSTGNWAFSGNNADLTGAGTMGIGLTTATAITLGASGIDTTVGGFLNIAATKKILAVAGSGGFDFSLATGIFKTSTGVNTFGGSSNSFTNGIGADPSNQHTFPSGTGPLVAAWTRTAVADTSPTVAPTAANPALAGYTSITAARTVTGTTAGSSAAPAFISVTDESGSASPLITITFAPSSGTIDGVASKIIVNGPHGWWQGYCNGTNWFTVAQQNPPAGWIAVAGGVGFQNSWVNDGGAGFATAAYTKINGIVFIKGYVKSGTALGTTVFTLPVGYRPAAEDAFVSSFNAATIGLVQVDPSGNVSLPAGSLAVSNTLSISFPAEK